MKNSIYKHFRVLTPVAVIIIYILLWFFLDFEKSVRCYQCHEIIIGFLVQIIAILGILSLIYSILGYQVSKKSLNLQVLQNCIVRWHQFIDDPKFTEEDSNTLKKYVDFVNEELFYIQHDYLPDEVKKEWLDGMIEKMPIYNSNGELLNPDSCLLKIHDEKMSQGFNRVKAAFTIKKINIDAVYDKTHPRHNRTKNKLINQILKNLSLNKGKF